MTMQARRRRGDPVPWPRSRAAVDDTSAADLVRQAVHDLRQPVAAIMALTAAAAVEPHLPEAVKQRLEQIAGQATWMSKIIRDLLADGAASPGGRPPTGGAAAGGAEVAEVSALVRDAVTAERLTYPGTIIVRLADEVTAYVPGTGVRLRRALANVLANATRAAGPGGRVEVIQRPDVGAVILEIVDDGPGFGRVGRDHGIGLRITRRMLAECGGHMERERTASGQTLVRLLLPTVPTGRAGTR